MKKKHIIISFVMAVGIILSGLALADSQRTDHRKDFGFKKHHKGSGLQLLCKLHGPAGGEDAVCNAQGRQHQVRCIAV